jgi:hypothetical protein
LVEFVRKRARFRCEYCQLPWDQLVLRFEVEHVLPRKHGGQTEAKNLAFACLHCNRFKGPNIAGIDREGTRRRVVPLFDPRRQRWSTHFRIVGFEIRGITSVGRVTIDVLAMNDPRMVALRETLTSEGRFPPA